MWLLCFVVTPCIFIALVLFCISILGVHLFGLSSGALMWSTLCVALYAIAETIIWGTMLLWSKIEQKPLNTSPQSIVIKLLCTLASPFMLFVMGTGLGNMLLSLFISAPPDPDTLYFFGACVAAMVTFFTLMACGYFLYHSLRLAELRRQAHSSQSLQKESEQNYD